MNEVGLPEILRRILRFLLHPAMWLITLIAIVGFLFGVQSKHTFEMTSLQPRVLEDQAKPGTRIMTIKPPIFHYSGPIVFSLQHNQLEDDISLTVSSNGTELSSTVIPAGDAGAARFYFFPEDFKPANGIKLTFSDGESVPLDDFFESATFDFPKVGAWLVPDISLWSGLLLIAICFGLICSIVWQTPTSVIASYAGTVAMLILACHFGGLAIAWRIANQLLAVILLLVSVFLIRWLAIPAKPVIIKS